MPDATPDCDAVIIGTGPAGRDRGRRAHRRGLVGDHAREGPQSPARARRAVRSARARVERRDQVLPPALPRTRSVPRAAHVPPRRRRRRPSVRGRGQQPAVDRRRRRLPRRRQAAALSRRRLQGPLRSSARSRAPTSSTGPSTTTRWSRTTPRPSGSWASPASGRCEPVRRVALGRVPDAARRRHVRRDPHDRSRDPARLSPVPRADRRELGSLRRAPGVQQLRLLRVLRLPDRRQRRSGRAVAQRAAHRPLRDPAAVVRGAGAARRRRALGARRPLPGRRRQRARGDRPGRDRGRRRVGNAAIAAALGDRELVGARRPVPHVPLPDLRGRAVPVPPARAPRPVGDASPRRPHDHRRREPRVRQRARAPLLPGRHRRARRRRASGARSDVHRARARAHAAMLESPMRDRLWAFTIQGEDLPQVTNRIDLDPCVRDVYGFPAGRATYDVHPHEVVASRYYAPKLAEIMREAGAETTFSITSPRLEGDRASRRRVDLAAHHGHLPHGRRPAHERRRPLAAVPRRREHGVHRLVGVPHVDRLRPDPHDRRPGDPRLPRARRPPPLRSEWKASGLVSPKHCRALTARQKLPHTTAFAIKSAPSLRRSTRFWRAPAPCAQNVRHFAVDSVFGVPAFIYNVTFDAKQPRMLGRFWSAVTSYSIAEERDDFVRLRAPDERGVRHILFFRVDDPTPGKNRCSGPRAEMPSRDRSAGRLSAPRSSILRSAASRAGARATEPAGSCSRTRKATSSASGNAY